MKPILFSPGPVMVEESVRQALTHYDICHRGSEFEEMFTDTQEKIKRLFKADDEYYSLIISGSGTSANEAVLSSLIRDGEAVLLISNGAFGERLKEILDNYQIVTYSPDLKWGERPKANAVEKLLQQHEDIRMVAMVYNETSSGLINPVREMGELAHQYGKWFFTDCVSAAAGQDVDVINENIDICTSVGGKCLGAFPGSAYVCIKESILQDIPSSQGRTVYLNLGKHYRSAKEKSQTPNTPNVQVIFALNEALHYLLDVEGLDNRLKRYKECADFLRDEMEKMGLKFLLPREQMCNTVTSVFLPEGLDLHEFLKRMEADRYICYAGKGQYEEMGIFQVANMGTIRLDDCREFLKVLMKNLNLN